MRRPQPTLRHPIHHGWVLALAFTLAACGSKSGSGTAGNGPGTESGGGPGGLGTISSGGNSSVNTAGIYAVFEAVSNGEQTQVSAELLLGGSEASTYLRLTGDDHLTATVGGSQAAMTDNNNDGRYQASFAVGAGGEVIEISFSRSAAAEDAPESSAALPEAFDLSGIDDGQLISRAEDLVLTWDPSGDDDEMKWNLVGDCIDTEFDLTQTDTGTLTLAAGRIEPKFQEDADQTCDVTFTLDRSRSGTVDSNFNDDSDGPGEFTAIQRREITFRSAP